MDATMLVAALSNFLTRLPWIVVAVIGIVIAAVRKSQNPKVSQLIIIALVLDLIMLAFSATVSTLVPYALMRDGGNTRDVGLVMASVSLCSSGVNALALALLLWAALGWREQPKPAL